MTFRPVLRPGALLLRRDATHLQVGTSPGIVIDDRPGLLPLLRLLDGTRGIERLQGLATTHLPDLDRPVAAILTELCALGAVVDASTLGAAARGRSARTVGLDVAPDSSELADIIRSVLASTGVTHVSSTEPDLLVITSYGEPARTVFERATLLGVAHLPVVIDEDRVRIGPFVRPGRTPCVGCHDLHRAEWDVAWPALLLQLGHGASASRPSALDPLAAHAAGVEVAAEVLAYCDDTVPRTVGRCLVVGPGHDERVFWPVAFHHRCACDLLSAA
jgi:hypothetical protein